MGFLYTVATDSEAMKEWLKEQERLEEKERDEFFNGDEEEEEIDETYSYSAYSLDATYQETLINRLDNILAMNILSTCFLFLLFYYMVKRGK